MAKTTRAKRTALIDYYKEAREWIDGSRFVREVTWQESIIATRFSETDFLREYAWVVLSSGFKASVVRKYFDYISLCFCDWESAFSITRTGRICVESVLPVFGNRRKLDAIMDTARLINHRGFESLKADIDNDVMPTLRALPFIGSVTSFHLAKNLGLDIAKPDRHLIRLAKRFGYDDVNIMCQEISDAIGDRIAVTDIVLWRFQEHAAARIQV